jgi:hypothetical protein
LNKWKTVVEEERKLKESANYFAVKNNITFGEQAIKLMEDIKPEPAMKTNELTGWNNHFTMKQ